MKILKKGTWVKLRPKVVTMSGRRGLCGPLVHDMYYKDEGIEFLVNGDTANPFNTVHAYRHEVLVMRKPPLNA